MYTELNKTMTEINILENWYSQIEGHHSKDWKINRECLINVFVIVIFRKKKKLLKSLKKHRKGNFNLCMAQP